MPITIIGNHVKGDLLYDWEDGDPIEYDLILKDNYVEGDLVINKLDKDTAVLQCSIKNDEEPPMSTEVLFAYHTFLLKNNSKKIVEECKNGQISEMVLHVSPNDPINEAVARCITFVDKYVV